MAHKSKMYPADDTQQKSKTVQTSGKSAQASMAMPKKGDTYRCNGCGMELEITEDCSCTHPEAVHFQCCGAEMSAVH